MGGFGAEYKTGFEDIDLCLKLRMLDTGTMSQTEVKSGTREVVLLKETIIKVIILKSFMAGGGKLLRVLKSGKERMAALLQRRKQYAHIIGGS